MEVLRIAGYVLILVSGSSMGWLSGYQLKQKIRQMKEFQSLLLYMKGEIKYSHQPVGELFLKISEKANEPYRSILTETGKELKRHQGKSLYEIWKENIAHVQKDLYFSKKEMEMLMTCGAALGNLDRESQISQLEFQLQQWGENTKRLQEQYLENAKLYRNLGVMGSILVVILLM